MSVTTQRSRGLLTLPDVAALAHVQRPVVSTWRKRSKGTAAPFPAAHAVAGSQELFDAEAIADWLEATGRGNNPHVRADLALHSMRDPGGTTQETLDALSALLTLKAICREPLAQLEPGELLDLADEYDADDSSIYSELAAVEDDLPALASDADELAGAAYTTATALEALIARHSRLGQIAHADSRLNPAVEELVAHVVVALVDEDRRDETTFVDPSGGSDLLVAVRRLIAELDHPRAALAQSGTPTSRRAVRRLLTHGWHVDEPLHRAREAPQGSRIILAQFPTPERPQASDEAILGALDDIALSMGEGDRAVVVGPASALVDHAHTPAVESVRSALLRSDRVRSVIRLPAGSWPARPRMQAAIWVLDAAHPDIPIRERWVTVADLSTATLNPATIEDTVTDVVAALGDKDTARGHAYRFARLVLTRTLLANAAELVGNQPQHRRRVRTDPAEAALRVTELSAELDAEVSGARLAFAVEHHERGPTAVLTLGELVARGVARVIAGNRIDDADVVAGADVTVIGPEEVAGGVPLGERTMVRLRFSGRYPSGRYTEPGDVVFCKGAAMVDGEGLAIVRYPARILRLDRERLPGLLPDVVARDLRAASPRAHWRSWSVRVVPAGLVGALTDALGTIATDRARLRRRLSNLDELETTLTDGVANGTLSLATSART